MITLCKRCKRPLIGHDVVHAVEGELYCSKACAISDIMDSNVLNAYQDACEKYADCAEVVATNDILGNELQSVKVTVSCTKTIRLPINMTPEQIDADVRAMLEDCILNIELNDCDEANITCELVKE